MSGSKQHLCELLRRRCLLVLALRRGDDRGVRADQARLRDVRKVRERDKARRLCDGGLLAEARVQRVQRLRQLRPFARCRCCAPGVRRRHKQRGDQPREQRVAPPEREVEPLRARLVPRLEQAAARGDALARRRKRAVVGAAAQRGDEPQDALLERVHAPVRVVPRARLCAAPGGQRGERRARTGRAGEQVPQRRGAVLQAHEPRVVLDGEDPLQVEPTLGEEGAEDAGVRLLPLLLGGGPDALRRVEGVELLEDVLHVEDRLVERRGELPAERGELGDARVARLRERARDEPREADHVLLVQPLERRLDGLLLRALVPPAVQRAPVRHQRVQHERRDALGEEAADAQLLGAQLRHDLPGEVQQDARVEHAEADARRGGRGRRDLRLGGGVVPLPPPLAARALAARLREPLALRDRGRDLRRRRERRRGRVRVLLADGVGEQRKRGEQRLRGARLLVRVQQQRVDRQQEVVGVRLEQRVLRHELDVPLGQLPRPPRTLAGAQPVLHAQQPLAEQRERQRAHRLLLRPRQRGDRVGEPPAERRRARRAERRARAVQVLPQVDRRRRLLVVPCGERDDAVRHLGDVRALLGGVPPVLELDVREERAPVARRLAEAVQLGERPLHARELRALLPRVERKVRVEQPHDVQPVERLPLRQQRLVLVQRADVLLAAQQHPRVLARLFVARREQVADTRALPRRRLCGAGRGRARRRRTLRGGVLRRRVAPCFDLALLGGARHDELRVGAQHARHLLELPFLLEEVQVQLEVLHLRNLLAVGGFLHEPLGELHHHLVALILCAEEEREHTRVVVHVIPRLLEQQERVLVLPLEVLHLHACKQC